MSLSDIQPLIIPNYDDDDVTSNFIWEPNYKLELSLSYLKLWTFNNC